MDQHGIWLTGTERVELLNGCRVCYDRATRRWWAWWKDGTILRGDNDEESLFTTKDEAIQCIADRLALKTVHQRPEAKAAASSDLLAACEGLTAVIRALADRYVTDPDEFDYIKLTANAADFLIAKAKGA